MESGKLHVHPDFELSQAVSVNRLSEIRGSNWSRRLSVNSVSVAAIKVCKATVNVFLKVSVEAC